MWQFLQVRLLVAPRHRDGLAGTWDWVDQDLTIVTVPNAGYFVQQDASELVSRTMRDWLAGAVLQELVDIAFRPLQSREIVDARAPLT